MTKAHIGIILTVLLSLVLAGCSSSSSGRVYSRGQARSAHSIQYGTVIDVQNVNIEGEQSGAGTLAGGVAGAAIGSQVGGGSGRWVGGALGAIGGALIGSATEEAITSDYGLEITVETDSGEMLVVVQEDDVQFYPGDRVRVLRDNRGVTRIRH